MKKKTYPSLTWRRGVVASAVLERAKDDVVLVAEITDTGMEDALDRYQGRWLAGGTQDVTARSTLDPVKAWVRALVTSRMGVSL